MYTSTSAIIQACNNSIFAYQIYFNLQNRYLNFFYLFHSNIFYLLPSKYTCTLGTSLTRKFSTKFEKRISSSINLKNVSSSTIFRRSWWGGGKKSCHNTDNVYCNWYPEINDKSGFCQCCRFYAYCMRFDLSSFFFSPFLFFSFSSFRHSFSHTNYIYTYI